MRQLLTFPGLWVLLLAIAGCGGSQQSPAELPPGAPRDAHPTTEETVAEAPAPSGSQFQLRAPQCGGIDPGENFFEQPPVLEPDVAQGGIFARCTPGARDHSEATEALSALDAAVQSAVITSAPDSLRARLVGLLRLRCFNVASEQVQLPPVASVESFKIWWHDGGHEWLSQYLTPVPVRAATSRDRVILFPPTEPRVLAQDSVHAAHPLQRLFCAADDASCSVETAPFRARLQQSIDSAHNIGFFHSDHERDAEIAGCAREAQGHPAAERYLAWHDCVEGLRVKEQQMPIVHAHAPHRGWLVTRSSEYVSDAVTCSRVCAYDFDSGAAHCARACGASNGSQRGETTVVSGRVPLVYLREFGWAMTFVDDVSDSAQSENAYELPHGIEPTWRGEPARSFGGSGSGGGCSTVVGLAWIVDSCIAQTQLFGFNSSDDEHRPATAHLGRLFRVLQQSFIEGCSPRTPTPTELPTRVNSEDGEVEVRLLTAILGARAPSCSS